MARRIIDFVNVATGTVLGLFLVITAVSAGALWDTLFLRIRSAPWGLPNLILIAGLILVVVNVWTLARMWRAGFFHRKLRVVSDEGANELSIPSLESLLVKELKTQPDVVDPKVALESKGEGHPVVCRLKYKLKRQENVIRRADELKKLVKVTFLRLLPAGVEIEIVGEVRGLVTEETPSSEKTSEFSGPVYPTDGGD